MDFEKEAAKAAAKICTRGCIASFDDCTKSREGFAANMRKLPPIPGANHEECPLAKYQVPDAPVLSFKERVERKMPNEEVTDRDIFCLCANCRHGEVQVDGSSMTVERPDFAAFCLTCPVQIVKESIEGARAEAQGS